MMLSKYRSSIVLGVGILMIMATGLLVIMTGGVETVLAKSSKSKAKDFVSLAELDLNRTAKVRNAGWLREKGFHNATTGFIWDAHFKLTEQSLDNLKNDNIPFFEKLKDLKDQEFETEKGFIEAVKAKIGTKEMEPYKEQIRIAAAGDNGTLYWRPQGIATIGKLGGKEFLAVAWYGRKSDENKDPSRESYADRGVRISFADVTDIRQKKEIKYRHVLLVKENGDTFKGMHAGGLVYMNRNLHVPESRESKKEEDEYPIHVFPVTSIKKVNPDDFYGYSYILKENPKLSYTVTIKPSFMSYNKTMKKGPLLIGRFAQCDEKDMRYHSDTLRADCKDDPKNYLAWYNVTTVKSEEITKAEATRKGKRCEWLFSEMQGAASWKKGKGGILWVASSYGFQQEKKSHLHIATTEDFASCNFTNKTTLVYPPGLESIYIDSSKGNARIWMLTEFGPDETKDGDNNRIVFATNKKDLMPIQKDKELRKKDLSTRIFGDSLCLLKSIAKCVAVIFS